MRHTLKRPAVMSVFAMHPEKIGGGETFVRELTIQLHEAGWDSIVCFLSPPTKRVAEFLELPKGSVITLPGTDCLDAGAVARFARVVREKRPEVVHLHFVTFLSPLPWIARLCGVQKIFLSDHLSRPEGTPFSPIAFWKRVIAKTLTYPLNGVIAVSDHVARHAATTGLVKRDCVRRVYNGVDLTRPNADGCEFRRRLGIPETRSVVLQVSWLIQQKGIDDLIETARIIRAENPEVHFIVAGNGPGAQEYAAKAEACGVGSGFTWTGMLEDPIREGVYSAADVVCQLSRWQEAFGWVITEAMACGKPVVATTVGGIPELVEDGVCGYLVSRRRPDEAAGAVLRLLSDASLRRRMGAAGRKIVEERFDLRNSVSELLGVYGIGRGVRRARLLSATAGFTSSL